MMSSSGSHPTSTVSISSSASSGNRQWGQCSSVERCVIGIMLLLVRCDNREHNVEMKGVLELVTHQRDSKLEIHTYGITCSQK